MVVGRRGTALLAEGTVGAKAGRRRLSSGCVAVSRSGFLWEQREPQQVLEQGRDQQVVLEDLTVGLVG